MKYAILILLALTLPTHAQVSVHEKKVIERPPTKYPPFDVEKVVAAMEPADMQETVLQCGGVFLELAFLFRQTKDQSSANAYKNLTLLAAVYGIGDLSGVEERYYQREADAITDQIEMYNVKFGEQFDGLVGTDKVLFLAQKMLPCLQAAIFETSKH